MTNIPPDLARSPIFDQSARPHPGLVRPGSSWGMGAGVAGACVLGVVTFVSLSNHRAPNTVAPPPAPPPVAAPRPIVAPPPAPILIQAAQPAPPAPLPQAAPTPDTHTPAMVVDFSQTPAVTAQAAPARPAAAPEAPADDKLSADERFSARVTGPSAGVARSFQLRDPAHTAPQGTVIPAVLETAINSDLPGFARAVITRDIRGFDGTTVLIPRGSKLVGQYRSGVALSQTRAFVVWSRVLTPDGVSIEIASPGTDALGRGGLEGETDTHFFQRFGSAILLSIMSAGLNALTQHEANTAIIIGSSEQANQVASVALSKQIDIPVTIKVPQGTPLQVFVTRDLDFSGTSK